MSNNNRNETGYKNSILQQIFYGAPGTGKSHKVNETTEQQPKENVFRTTFHPDSDYSTFVGCYKPTMKPTGVILASKENEEVITYKFVAQAFTKAYIRAWQTNENVFLVIEEINRGNCAQIFGDLFQLLDRENGISEYPVDADTDLADFIRTELANSDRTDIPAEVKNGQKLMLPSNLYIWATMNTSDQSLFPIDSAFKRRWEWKYLPINNHEDKNYKIEIGSTKYDWWGFLSKINEVIGNTTSSEDKKLGYFFAKANENGIVTAEQFVGKVLFYLWNDVFKNYGFDNQIFDKGDKKKFDFSDFFKQDGSPDTDMVNKFLGKLDETIDKENSFVEKPKNDKGQEELSDTEA
jgi:5-methylcytosine-specific restriction endonuclease McrBC GTP-binding regulatory subunit McrB